MSTLPFAGPFDDLLIPFDPTRGFERWWGQLEVHAAADPKVATARKLMEDRLEPLPEADLDAIGTLFWAVLRRGLRAGGRPQAFRAWLSDGDQVLRSVQSALDSFLTQYALSELARETRRLESADSSDAEDLTLARAEVQQITSTDFVIGGLALGALSLAAGVGIAVIAIEVEAAIHGHEGIVYHGPHGG